jgi:hypothetical protein
MSIAKYIIFVITLQFLLFKDETKKTTTTKENDRKTGQNY